MVQTVPYVPTRLREARFREAIEDYVNDEITEQEMEAEMDAAIEGRIEYKRLLKFQGTIRTPDLDPGSVKFMNIEIEHGESIVAEETAPLEVGEIDTTVTVETPSGPILGSQSVQ